MIDRVEKNNTNEYQVTWQDLPEEGAAEAAALLSEEESFFVADADAGGEDSTATALRASSSRFADASQVQARHHGHRPAPHHRPAPRSHPAPQHRPAPHPHPVPRHHPPHHHSHPDYYRNRPYYPQWHYQVTLVLRGGHYYYDGPDLSIGSYSGLANEKRAIDYARQDLNDSSYRYGRQSPEYRQDAQAVVYDYAHLLGSVFRYGDNHPGDGTLFQRNYQELVDEIWYDLTDVLRDYESANPWDNRLRDDALDALYWTAQGSGLKHQDSFYRHLLERIRSQRD